MTTITRINVILTSFTRINFFYKLEMGFPPNNMYSIQRELSQWMCTNQKKVLILLLIAKASETPNKLDNRFFARYAFPIDL